MDETEEDADMANNELYKEIMQAYEPTPEDIAKKLSTEELILLCKRTKVRVDMWKWNPVEDFAALFRSQGRFVGQSQKYINKLLLKAYKRRSRLFINHLKKQENEREREWQERKKMSLLRLKLWRYEEEKRLEKSEVETVVAPPYELVSLEIERLPDQENATEEPSNHFEGELNMVINSESMTILTDSIPPSENVSEGISTINLSLKVSDMQDEPIMPFQSETQSENVNYDSFQEFLPLTSTQDAVC